MLDKQAQARTMGEREPVQSMTRQETYIAFCQALQCRRSLVCFGLQGHVQESVVSPRQSLLPNHALDRMRETMESPLLLLLLLREWKLPYCVSEVTLPSVLRSRSCLGAMLVQLQDQRVSCDTSPLTSSSTESPCLTTAFE